jgi:L-fucose isomerase-like protein
MGALSMYALASANMSPASIADWNNNFGDDRDKCVLFHCGNFAAASLETRTWAPRTSSAPPWVKRTPAARCMAA